MANLLEALLSEGGQPGAYIPNALENINKEIENFSVYESIKSMPPEQMDLIQGLVMGTMCLAHTKKRTQKPRILTISRKNRHFY